MAFIPVPGCIKAELVFTAEGTIFENVLNYGAGPTVSVEELTDLAGSLVDMWVNIFQAATPSACSLIKVKCTSLDDQFAPGIEYVTGLPEVGAAAVDMLPLNVAIQAIFYTSLRGRSYRGRMFIPGIAETNVTGSSVTTLYHTQLQAAIPAMIHLSGELGDYDLMVVSRYLNKQARVTGVQTPVESIAISPHVVSQRRRLPGRGV